MGRKTSFSYTSQGKTSGIKHADGSTEYRTYDREGRCSGKRSADGCLIEYSYNLDGNPVRITGRRPEAEELTHYLRETPEYWEAFRQFTGRARKRIRPEKTRTYRYAPDGRLAEAVGGGTAYRYTYDKNGRLCQKSALGTTLVTCTYDRNGRLHTIETPAGKSVYAYDRANRLKNVWDGTKLLAEYTYRKNGQTALVRCGNGLCTRYGYDERSQLISLTAGFDGEKPLLATQYRYDKNGNRIQKEEAFPEKTETTCYRYDVLGRLTAEKRGNHALRYRYDAAGNRLEKETDGVTERYWYDSRNRLTGRSNGREHTQYTYDMAGNLTREEHQRIGRYGNIGTGQRISYEYDVFRQNTAVCGNDFIQRNRYDAEGYRYEAEENGTVNRFVYHEGMPLAELDEENMPKAGQYLGNGFLGGRLRKKKDSVPLTVPQTDEKDRTPTIPTISTIPTVPSKPELCYYIGDEQGSIRYVIGEDGTVGNRYRYDAFGVPEETEEAYDNRLRYNGQIYDELTEQYYLRARYYQPQLGRFTQEDLLFADGLNLYAYCTNNPVMYSDPSGLAKKQGCRKKEQGECSRIYSGDLMSDDDAARYSEYWRKQGIGSENTWNEFIKNNPNASVDDYFKIIRMQSPWPLDYVPSKFEMSGRYRFEMALATEQPSTSPGRFATVPGSITDVDYVRASLAVKPEWKPDINRVVMYEVKEGVTVNGLQGPVGPQIVLDIDKYLPGGADQIQILLDRDIDIEDYFSIIGMRKIQ